MLSPCPMIVASMRMAPSSNSIVAITKTRRNDLPELLKYKPVFAGQSNEIRCKELDEQEGLVSHVC
jgi:hypothetical protein